VAIVVVLMIMFFVLLGGSPSAGSARVVGSLVFSVSAAAFVFTADQPRPKMIAGWILLSTPLAARAWWRMSCDSPVRWSSLPGLLAKAAQTVVALGATTAVVLLMTWAYSSTPGSAPLEVATGGCREWPGSPTAEVSGALTAALRREAQQHLALEICATGDAWELEGGVAIQPVRTINGDALMMAEATPSGPRPALIHRQILNSYSVQQGTPLAPGDEPDPSILLTWGRPAAPVLCGARFHQRFIDETGAIAGIAIWTHSPNEASDRLIDAYFVPAPIVRRLLTSGHADAASFPRSPASGLSQPFEFVGLIEAEPGPGLTESDGDAVCSAAPVEMPSVPGVEATTGGS
jgi:hypothetical protein